MRRPSSRSSWKIYCDDVKGLLILGGAKNLTPRIVRISMRTSITVISLCLFGLLLPLGAASKNPRGYNDGLPRLPNASLLIGISPFFLEVTNEHEDILLQRENGDIRDASSLFPSIS